LTTTTTSSTVTTTAPVAPPIFTCKGHTHTDTIFGVRQSRDPWVSLRL
jgi:hypothetical protein